MGGTQKTEFLHIVLDSSLRERRKREGSVSWRDYQGRSVEEKYADWNPTFSSEKRLGDQVFSGDVLKGEVYL